MNDELMGGGNVWRKKQIGYDPVKVEDLEFPEQIGAYNVNPAGEVTRGARGQEVLMMLPSQRSTNRGRWRRRRRTWRTCGTSTSRRPTW
jgi:hypothetical protein